MNPNALLSLLLMSSSSFSFVEGYLQDFLIGSESNFKLDWSLNPGCDSECKNKSVNIVDVSESVSDIRWLWDVSESPGIYSLLTKKPDTPPSVSWKEFLSDRRPGSIKYGQDDPIWASSVLWNTLIEFNDTKDDMNVDYSRCGLDDSYCLVYPMHLFTWESKVLRNTSTHLSIQFLSLRTPFASSQNGGNSTGKINITLSAFVEKGYGAWLPHLAHSYRTCEMDIQLDGLKTGSNFTHGRFAVQLLVGSSNLVGEFSRRQTKSLNDEHTPGIFKTDELMFPGKNKSEGAYIQWRPIVYTKVPRGLADSTGVIMSKGHAIEKKADAFRSSSFYALYGKKIDHFSARYYYVAFGGKKDGFYSKTLYNAWTFTLGHGSPIDGALSQDIILASCVMAVVVLLSIITSSSFCVYKRWKSRMAEPQFSYGQI